MRVIQWLGSAILVGGLTLGQHSIASSLEKTSMTSLPSLKPKISIVIDDLGDNSIIARKMLSLPGKMTAAILPQTPHAKLISKIASENGHDIIMHLPMEAYSRPDLLGPGALLQKMDQATFSETLKQNIESIPNIIGINNHMGSLLTNDIEKMSWLMSEAKDKQFLFLDSKTSDSSIAEDVAEKYGVPALGRDIFLDHKGAENNINQQFERAQNIAKKTGKAIVICHPYPETLDFLRSNIERINRDFLLVGLSDLLIRKEATREWTVIASD
jgi:uncharacterized protein